MDAKSLDKLSRAIWNSLEKEDLLDFLLWPEICRFLADKGIRGEVLRLEKTPSLKNQESGIWIRLWVPTIFSSDTFWAVVPHDLAMKILVLGELP